MPSTAGPVSAETGPISSATEPAPCTVRRQFEVKAKIFKVNDGGGVYALPPWLKLCGPK